MKKIVSICLFLRVCCFVAAQNCAVLSVTALKKDVCQHEVIQLTFKGTPPFTVHYTVNNGVTHIMTVTGMSTTFVATQSGKYVFTVRDTCSVLSQKDGVEINGVIWATRNVDNPGTFAKNPEDAGMFYQWNKKKAWAAIGAVAGWDNTVTTVRQWEEATDPCPMGWRIPTATEIENLNNSGSKRTTSNGVGGFEFGNGANTIFVAAGGFRYFTDGKLMSVGEAGNFWSNVESKFYNPYAYHMGFNMGFSALTHSERNFGFNIRCVKDLPKDSVTVRPTKKETKTATICSPDTYFFNGKYYNTTGEYTASLKTSFGCDSIVTLKLTVNQSYNIQEVVTICSDELPFTFRDTTFRAGAQSGNYVFKRKTKQGCDSTVTLKLTVNDALYEEEQIAICENGLPFTFRDTTFKVGTQSGVYVLKRKTPQGCNKIVTLNLIVHRSYNLKEQTFLCDAALPFRFRDTTFDIGTTSGNYVFKRKSIYGCDSTVTLALRVNQPELTEYAAICDNAFPFVFRDTTFRAGTQSGDYVFRRTSQYGCDSIVILKLSVDNTYTTYDTITLYDNDLPFTYLGMTFTHGSYSGDYMFNPRTATACDSIVLLNLTIYQILHQTVCESEFPLQIRDTWFPKGTQSGVYEVDSGKTTLILTVNPTPQFTIGDADAVLKMITIRPPANVDTTHFIGNTLLKSANIISCTNADYENVAAGDFSPPFNANARVQWTIIYENGNRYTVPNANLQTLLAATELFPSVGTYRIEAVYQYESNGKLCASETAAIEYAVIDPPQSPLITQQQRLCEGELTPLHAEGSPQVRWISTDKKLPNSEGVIYDFERLGQMNIPTGQYQFELFDTDTVSGCESNRVAFSLEIAPAAQPHIVGNTELCVQAIEELYEVETAAQGSTYSWKTSGNHYNYSKNGDLYSSTRYVDWNGVGIDTLIVHERTLAGCEGSDTLIVSIADYPKPNYTYTVPDATTAIEFTDASYQAPIVAQNSNGTQVEIPLTYTMEWFFDNEEQTTLFVEYHERYNPIRIEQYSYGYKNPILTVTNSFGCQVQYSTEIFVDIPSGIYIPNAFSPHNASESVRIFKPIAFNLQQCKLWIYDKWGNLMYYSEDVQNGTFAGEWDGTYNGELLPADVYMWKLEAQFLDGSTWAGQKKTLGYTRFGNVTLIR